MLRGRYLIAAAVVIAIPAVLDPVLVYTEGGSSSGVTVPTLLRMSGVEADLKLHQLGLETYSDQSAMIPSTPSAPGQRGRIDGGTLTVTVFDPPPGFVVEQTPPPGTEVQKGGTVYITVAPTASG